MNVEKMWSEQATGIRENAAGLGKYYLSEFEIVTPTKAYDALREGKPVQVPNAGAGSASEFFKSCGFSEVRSFETSSSAGDWTFGVKDGEGGSWYPAFQTNRYPRHGFTYSVDFQWAFETFEELCALPW